MYMYQAAARPNSPVHRNASFHGRRISNEHMAQNTQVMMHIVVRYVRTHTSHRILLLTLQLRKTKGRIGTCMFLVKPLK